MMEITLIGAVVILLCVLVLQLVNLVLVEKQRFYAKQLQGNSEQTSKQLDQLIGSLAEISRFHNQINENIVRLLKEQQQEQHQQRIRFDEYQIKSLKLLQDSIQKGMSEIRQQVTEALAHNAEFLGKRVDKLTEGTDLRLKEISNQVEKRLSEGFEKTTATFTDVIKRLALIDEAQKKITELSGNVISLQEVLVDKRSRGAFGEVQMSALINNLLPESHVSFQHTLSNGNRADCILFLPEPTGNVVIDAKFPLEGYRRFTDPKLTGADHRAAEQQFRRDVLKHIKDIASKYLIPGETAEGAVMFIPAEAVFAEIHAHYPDIVETAHKARVWMTSPTTLMAILTTARAVIKDAATRKQVHIIQDHLVKLGEDFDRFQTRMNALSNHIRQAHEDVQQVHKSSKKITSRFTKIEKVELNQELPELLEEEIESESQA